MYSLSFCTHDWSSCSSETNNYVHLLARNKLIFKNTIIYAAYLSTFLCPLRSPLG